MPRASGSAVILHAGWLALLWRGTIIGACWRLGDQRSSLRLDRFNLWTINMARRGRGRALTLSFRRDPVLLSRMEQAFKLQLQGYSYREIALVLGIDVRQAWTDVDNGRTLAREMHVEAMFEARERHLIELDNAIHEAWHAFRTANSGSLNRSGYLNSIRGFMAERAKVLGLYAADKHEISGPDGGPIELTDADLDRKIAGFVTRLAIREGSGDVADIIDISPESSPDVAVAGLGSEAESASA